MSEQTRCPASGRTLWMARPTETNGNRARCPECERWMTPRRHPTSNAMQWPQHNAASAVQS